LYEKKLQLEQKQYNDLAKEKDQLKQDYEDQLKDMDNRNEMATEKLLNEFKVNLADVQEQYDNSKRTSDGLKMIYEERLTQTEDDDAVEIRELKRVYEREI
jgi:t-SNARE complex subunit (syntaxin)